MTAQACFYNPTGSEPTASGADSTTLETSESGDGPTTGGPLECNNDGECDPGEDAQNCVADCVVPPGCGDDVKSGDEACDDGADNGMYGRCNADCSGVSACGDGKQNGTEKCDEGPGNNDDYTREPHCNGDCSALAPYCGDEVCDSVVEDANNCGEDCKPGCGNGVQEPGEDCDDGSEDTPTCDADCSLVECGDMRINAAANEACDDGNANNSDACVNCQAAACGDGFVQIGVELCDDGDGTNDNECSNACQPPRRVFVTSLGYKANLGGLDGADEKCQIHAGIVELEGTFRAWLSDDTGSPSTRFDTAFTGSYQLLDGTVVASNGWDDLTDASLAHAIDLNEKAAKTEQNVWTNTLPDGTAVPLGKHCTNWTTGGNDVTNTPTYGTSDAVDLTWTQLLTATCGTSNRLYCFENP